MKTEKGTFSLKKSLFNVPIWKKKRLFHGFVVMGAFTTDEFGACTCGNQDCLPDMRLGHVQRDSDLFEVHADKGPADIEAGIGLDMLDCNSVLKCTVAGCCKRATRLGLRHNVHDFCVWLRGMFDDDGAVQVFAALCRDVDAERLEHGREPFKNRLADFGHGMAPDVVTEGRTRAATDYDDFACSQVRFFNEFFSGVLCVVTNLFNKVLVVYFVCNAGYSHSMVPGGLCVTSYQRLPAPSASNLRQSPASIP